MMTEISLHKGFKKYTQFENFLRYQPKQMNEQAHKHSGFQYIQHEIFSLLMLLLKNKYNSINCAVVLDPFMYYFNFFILTTLRTDEFYSEEVT